MQENQGRHKGRPRIAQFVAKALNPQELSRRPSLGMVASVAVSVAASVAVSVAASVAVSVEVDAVVDAAAA